MKQFRVIFGFEFKNYLKNKIFVGVTAVCVILLAGLMFAPRVMAMLDVEKEENRASEDSENDKQKDWLYLSCGEGEVQPEQMEMIKNALQQLFEEDYQVEIVSQKTEEIKEAVVSKTVEAAICLQDALHYTYYVNDFELTDEITPLVDEALKSCYQSWMLQSHGISAEESAGILSVEAVHEIEALGTDQTKYFFYTYIMLFALYMVILLYGQMVATNVATEKSSRAMELLITSAKPVNMMFGKVIASCMAGLMQLILIFGTAILGYQLNTEYWGENLIVRSIFDMPIELLIYMLLFFVLGFFIYAFLYGAIGSMASKVEDINTSVMPLTMLFLATFMIVMFSMSSGNVDNLLMQICSYVPFTSPMAMFTRIAMSSVSIYEIITSIAILFASVVGVGVISAKIYRAGVLMYGTPPKPMALLRAIKNA